MLQIKNTLGGGKPEGLYAWKKYSIGFKYKEASVNKYENISIDTPQSGSIKVYTGSSYTFDENTGMYTLVDPFEYSVKLNGATTTFTQIYVTYKSPTSANMWIHNSGNYGFQVYNYTSSGVTLNRNSSDYPIMEYSAETEPTYTFLDYIVSDKETAYPDGGEKGGYWYERVREITPEMFGCSKIAVDEFIPTANRSMSATTVQHSLGEIPKAVIIADTTSWEDYYKSKSSYTIKLAFIPNFGASASPSAGASALTYYYSSSVSKADYTNATGSWTMTTNTIKGSSNASGFSSYAFFMANHKYTIITMA